MTTSRLPPRTRVTYRRVTIADLPLLVDHRHRMWSDIATRSEREITEHDARFRRWARSLLANGELIGWVAESPTGSVIGSGCVWFHPDQPRPGIPSLVSPYILSMYTEPAWRGRGTATRIVRELVRDCRQAGYPNVELHGSRFGRRIYGRLGFERTWEMRYWIDRRVPQRQALALARAQGKRKKGLDRAR
ncbi:MAG: GNAT family N-acetyltransferase [Thermoplasmata archaeon]